jgi:hypothetical protein
VEEVEVDGAAPRDVDEPGDLWTASSLGSLAVIVRFVRRTEPELRVERVRVARAQVPLHVAVLGNSTASRTSSTPTPRPRYSGETKTSPSHAMFDASDITRQNPISASPSYAAITRVDSRTSRSIVSRTVP